MNMTRKEILSGRIIISNDTEVEIIENRVCVCRAGGVYTASGQ